MGRDRLNSIMYVARQLRRFPLRSATLAGGILVATVSFSLLAAAATTSQVQASGTVAAHFRSTYDILVRPAGSTSAVESGTALVRPNAESGLFGGITEKQWENILQTPGVAVAAPIENIGNVLASQHAEVNVGRFLPTNQPQLVRIHLTWLGLNGNAQYPGTTPYVYVTPQAGGCMNRRLGPPDPQSPYDAEGPSQGQLWCYEVAVKNGTPCFMLNGFANPRPLIPCEADVEIDVSAPRLIAAIDPIQENKLLPLDRTVVSGTRLTEATDSSLYRSG